MPIYIVNDKHFDKLDETTFVEANLKEIELKNMIKPNIESISPDTLIIGDELVTGKTAIDG